ncbi:phage terminase large subunit family protein [Candidatus Magnetobacterium casense]|uniref:Phage terminase large subunit family protein n=1 Tax=Candidatus Magnetobacterium casense TaxID=1455061 RepID=A0ABS6S417_9BACT|nr:phage terminase large subunit family protein [Candidatus Magnetobacterium casensis]MBV6343590.1 phage terminase large subunit family protein [Candidatus Magnetobacterium casensis]
MSVTTESKKAIIRKFESDDDDLLFVGRMLHRTHKNIIPSIPYKSPLWWLYTDENPVKHIKKAVQIGVSEWLIVTAIQKASKGLNVIYVLPTFTLKNQFVQDRLNKSIMYSRFYQKLLSLGDKRMVESLTLKQFGEGSIIFAGSNTTVSFISHPGDLLIIDEEDECHAENLVMAEERLAKSTYKGVIRVGNPRYINTGIDYQFNQSDKKEWFQKHECGEWIQLDFFKQVVREAELRGGGRTYVLCDKEWEEECGRDIYMICQHCGRPIDRFQPGEFIPQVKKSISGYHMSSLFAGELSIQKIDVLIFLLISLSLVIEYYAPDGECQLIF